MAKGDSGDMLMMFQKTASSGGIEAEGQSEIDKNDTFTQDFVSAVCDKKGHVITPSKFFEVDDFESTSVCGRTTPRMTAIQIATLSWIRRTSPAGPPRFPG